MNPRHTLLGSAALLCLLVGAVPAAGEPEGTSRYAPIPPGIDAIVASEREQALADMALDALTQGTGPGRSAARAQLVLLEGVGLKAVARRLAQGGVPRHALADLLQVVASSGHPEADLLLERAGGEARPGLRMIAADGLGRGRSPRAVPKLAQLSRDDVPGVRIAALRSLFAIDTPQARAARIEVPPDTETGLLTARLRWHLRMRDADESLRKIARDAWRRGSSVELRAVAAELLTLPRLETPQAVLLDIVREMGTHPLIADLMRWARGQPRDGYEPVVMRRVAIAAAMTLLDREGLAPEVRKALIERAIHWIARPVAMDPYGREPIPETRLRRRLPDFGGEILAPVVERLRSGGFAEPRSGVLLLRELGAKTALPILRALVRPRDGHSPFESRAEAEQRRYLRSAASGVIHELRRIDDEALARALVLGDEPQEIKRDILWALAGDPGAWVVPLLGEVVGGKNWELRSWALDLLEQRLEPAAYEILVKDLFQRLERPQERLKALVRRADDRAFQLLERALKDERTGMRKAGLSQFHRVRAPQLCGRRGRQLLRAFRPDLGKAREVQDYVYALLSTEPGRAVQFVRENWKALKGRTRVLRQLQETRGKRARREAIDFALAQSSPRATRHLLLSIGAVLKGYWDHRPEDVAAFWRRGLTSPIRSLRWQAIQGYQFEGAPDVTDVLLPMLTKALDSKALDDEAALTDMQEFAREILDALRFQSWAKVEQTFIDVALEPLNVPSLRLLAAQALLGRVSKDGRARLMRWLGDTPSSKKAKDDKQKSVYDDSSLQLHLAAAVGEGGTPAVAETLFHLLRKTILSFYSAERMARMPYESLRIIDEGAPTSRAMALARGIAHTNHAPTVESLLDIFFDLRFAAYARTSVKRQREFLRAASADAAASVPSALRRLGHRYEGAWDPEPLHGMPHAIFQVMSQVKVLDDERLAGALERVLSDARDKGRLAHFPDLYLTRLIEALQHKPTGAKPKSIEVVHRHVRSLEDTEGPIDYFAAFTRVTELTVARRFREAIPIQQMALRILTRRGHADRDPAIWHMQRARLDAIEGSAFAQQGLTEQARDRYRRAVLRAPNDPNVLNTVAWQRYLAGFDLELSEADALRATNLESRVDNRPTLNAADTLAVVLLARGKPHRAIDVLQPRMKHDTRDGLLYWHLAQMYAAAGRLDLARPELIKALTFDPALEAGIAKDRYLKPFSDENRLARLRRAVAESRIEEGLR